MLVALEAIIVLCLLAAIIEVVQGFNRRSMKRLEQKDQAIRLALRALESTNPANVKRTFHVAGELMPDDTKAALEEHLNDLEFGDHDYVRRLEAAVERSRQEK